MVLRTPLLVIGGIRPTRDGYFPSGQTEYRKRVEGNEENEMYHYVSWDLPRLRLPSSLLLHRHSGCTPSPPRADDETNYPPSVSRQSEDSGNPTDQITQSLHGHERG